LAVLQRDAEHRDAEVSPQTLVPLPARPRSFSSVMRDSYDDTIMTPWDQNAYGPRRFTTRKSSDFEATQESDELLVGAAVKLGPESQRIADAGQSSVVSSMPPPDFPRGHGGFLPSRGMGIARGGRGGRRTDRGRLAHRSVFDGDQPLGGLGSDLFHRRSSERTATVAADLDYPYADAGHVNPVHRFTDAGNVDLDHWFTDAGHVDLDHQFADAGNVNVGPVHRSSDAGTVDVGPVHRSSDAGTVNVDLDHRFTDAGHVDLDHQFADAGNVNVGPVHRSSDAGTVNVDPVHPSADVGREEDSADESESSIDEMPQLSPTPDYISLWTTGPYRGSRAALAARAYIHARELGWTTLDAARFKQIGAMILCSMPFPILDALVRGNLARLQRLDKTRWYSDNSDLLAQGDKEAPVVYAVLIVDKHTGKHVPRVRLAEVARVIRRYVQVATDPEDSSIDEAVLVDNAYRMPSHAATEREHIWAGRHRFLWQANKKGGGGKRQVKRITIIQSFCAALENKCRENKSVTLPLQYIGYALCYSTRTPAHTRGEGSSFLLQLVRHVLQMLYPNEYDVEAYPVFFACSAEEARVGEQLLTLVGHGLAESGRGLGVHPAGINNASADLKGRSVEEADRIWRECREFRDEMGWFAHALEKEVEVLARINKNPGDDVKQQEEELTRIQREIAELDEEWEDQYGMPMAERIAEDIDNARLEVDALAEEGGAGVEPLVARWRAELDADDAALRAGWSKWYNDTVKLSKLRR
jgi:hypothetical protein